MNLSRALDADLPALPRQYQETFFRFDPTIFWREEVTPLHTTVYVITKSHRLVSFTPERWKLVKMFDGRRTYEQLAALWKQTCNVAATPEQIREYAEALDGADFWQKTAQEASAALMNELMQDRQQVVRRKEPISISRMYVFVRDSDKEVSALYRYMKFMFTPHFVIFSLVALGLMIVLWISQWQTIFADSLQFWNMAEKTGWDVAEFYLIFAVVGFVHESGHALTAKHFGAGVHRTGLMLVFTVPAFFVNLAEVWVHAGRWARIAAILGGFWFEGLLCFLGTLMWWGTGAGTTAHDLGYKIILVAGIMPVIFNLNPLVPLDGYLCLCEILRIQALKEKATHFTSMWVQRHVFRMDKVVPALPRRRAIFFAAFSLLSGVYTYSMSLFLARLSYRLLHNYTPQWAFLPAFLIGLRLFKTRINKFVAFCKVLYLDKRELMRVHRKKLVFTGAAVLVFALLPIWHESVLAPFVLEPVNNAVLHAEVPGRVSAVYVREGDRVKPGTPLLRIENSDVSTGALRAASAVEMAGAREREARLRYVGEGGAVSELRQRQRQFSLNNEQQTKLSVAAPIAGTVLTPRIADLNGTYVGEGAPLVEVGDESVLRARIFLVEADLDALASAITDHALLLPGNLRAVHGAFQGISPTDQKVPDGILPATKIKAFQSTSHFVATVLLSNSDGKLRAGMTGEAKIFGQRRTLIGLVTRPLVEFVGRKIW